MTWAVAMSRVWSVASTKQTHFYIYHSILKLYSNVITSRIQFFLTPAMNDVKKSLHSKKLLKLHS